MATDDALAALVSARARAEAAEVVGMLAEADTENARVDASDWGAMRRLVAKQAIALDIAVATGRSEGQVINLLAAARRVRDRAPSTWRAFGRGQIDLVRTREIASTLNVLERPESWDRLDASVVDYASSHTLAELRAWLKRFVARVEADLATERANALRRERRVDIAHGDDSMSWINAFVPSHVAAAIDRRLDREARRLRAEDSTDADGQARTLDQLRADLLASWATSGVDADGATIAAVDAHISVVIDAEALAGGSPGFAISTDGTWSVPVEWMLESALASDPVWHRLLLDPITKNVLAVDSVGRFASPALATAIELRDGVCRAPGCLKPAQDCDKDHREPWPAGRTNADNLWALCRRHHAMKGHGFLRWQLPSGRSRPADEAEYGPPPPGLGPPGRPIIEYHFVTDVA